MFSYCYKRGTSPQIMIPRAMPTHGLFLSSFSQFKSKVKQSLPSVKIISNCFPYFPSDAHSSSLSHAISVSNSSKLQITLSLKLKLFQKFQLLSLETQIFEYIGSRFHKFQRQIAKLKFFPSLAILPSPTFLPLSSFTFSSDNIFSVYLPIFGSILL